MLLGEFVGFSKLWLGLQDEQKEKPVSFIFLHTSWLIRMKFDVVLVSTSETSWYYCQMTLGEVTAALQVAAKTISIHMHSDYRTLHFDSSLSDLDFDSKPQGLAKVKTCTQTISHSSQVICIDLDILLRVGGMITLQCSRKRTLLNCFCFTHTHACVHT